jgi:hypothetical protein
MAFIDQTSADAPEFIARVETIAARATYSHPETVYLVRIDNWFGERWVGFAGKVSGVMGVRFQSNLVLPPFAPSRVVRQVCYRFSTPAGGYVREECAEPIHVHQPSSANLRRFVSLLLPTSALVWFSDQSARSGRGSVMAYVPSAEGHDAWYVDFASAGGWTAKRLIGLTQEEVAAAP